MYLESVWSHDHQATLFRGLWELTASRTLEREGFSSCQGFLNVLHKPNVFSTLNVTQTTFMFRLLPKSEILVLCLPPNISSAQSTHVCQLVLHAKDRYACGHTVCLYNLFRSECSHYGIVFKLVPDHLSAAAKPTSLYLSLYKTLSTLCCPKHTIMTE